MKTLLSALAATVMLIAGMFGWHAPRAGGTLQVGTIANLAPASRTGVQGAWKECTDPNGFTHEVAVSNAEYASYGNSNVPIPTENVLATSSGVLTLMKISCGMAFQSPTYDTASGHLEKGTYDTQTGVGIDTTGATVHLATTTKQVIMTSL